jgi:di/tricarboxylate transporter
MVAAAIAVLTEFTSNVATANVVLPLLAEVSHRSPKP